MSKSLIAKLLFALKRLPIICRLFYTYNALIWKKRTGMLKGPYVDKMYLYEEDGMKKAALLRHNVSGLPAPDYESISENETIMLYSPKKNVFLYRKLKLAPNKEDFTMVDEKLIYWRNQELLKYNDLTRAEINKWITAVPMVATVITALSIWFVLMGYQNFNMAQMASTTQEYTSTLKQASDSLKDIPQTNRELIDIVIELIDEKNANNEASPPPKP